MAMYERKEQLVTITGSRKRDLTLEKTTTGPAQFEPSSTRAREAKFQALQPSLTESIVYKYHKLSSSISSVRLLELLPGDENDHIRCKITEASLEDQRDYCAVSYRWGSSIASGLIILNDEILQVRETLWWLLYHLRLRDSSRVLWIDGICIDQSNIPERNTQVQLMNRIYSDAKVVLVFLGLADEKSDAAMTCLLRKHESPCTSLDNLLVRPSIEEIDAMESLCSREYWNRTWILQEVLVAGELELQCGAKCVPWAAFGDLARKFCKASYNAERDTKIKRRVTKISRGSAIRLINHRSDRLRSVSSSDLASLLERYRLCECTDRRDSVYALLGLADDEPMKYGLKPDYEKHVVALYVDVLHYSKTEASKMLWFSFLLQTMLRLRPKDIYTYHRERNAQAMIPLKVQAASFGRISYVFPSLSILQPGHDPFSSYLDDSDGESDIDFDDGCIDSLGYAKYTSVRQINDNLWSVVPIDEPVQEELDERTLPNNISYTPEDFHNSRAKHSADFDHPGLPWPMGVARRDSEIESRQDHHLEKAYLKLFDRRERARRMQSPQSKLIEANGKGFQRRAGYACDHAQAGDMICQFIGSDVGLVVRRQRGLYKIVGRVDMMEQNLPNNWGKIAEASEMFSPMMLTQEAFHEAHHMTLELTALDILKLARPDVTSFTVSGHEDRRWWLDYNWFNWLRVS